MSNEFDLNIQNYTIKDLILLLNLDTYSTIQYDNINEKCERLKERLMNTRSSTASFRQNAVIFLEQVKESLYKHVSTQNQGLVPYTQSNFLNDKTPNSIFNMHNSPTTLEGNGHSVIMQKVVPVQNINPYPYPVGVVNGIEKRVINKIISVDSLFRENYTNTTPSNFTLNFPELINNVVSMNLMSIQLPSWYTISRKTKNNFFNVTMTNMVSPSSSTQTVYLPDGNYNATELVTALNNYFQNRGNGLQYLIVEMNTTMNRMLIRIRNDNDSAMTPPLNYNVVPNVPYVSWAAFIAGSNFSFVLDFLPSSYFGVVDESPCTILPSTTRLSKDVLFCKTSKTRLNTLKRVCIQNSVETNNYALQNTLGWYMGYRQKTYTVTSNTLYTNLVGTLTTRSYLGCIIAEASVTSTLDNYVFLEVNDYHNSSISNSVISGLPNTTLLSKNILARISLTRNADLLQVENNIIPGNKNINTREYLGPIKLQKISVRLLNRFGQELALSDNNWSFALNLDVLYT